MPKKKKKTKATKRAAKKPVKPESSGSTGFGHLTIPPNTRVVDTSSVSGGEKDIDSMECWDGCEWEDE